MCPFAKKTKNIQNLGGALAIIIDNVENNDPENVIMIDDGTGSSIAIPTILISKRDGNLIKAEIQRTEEANKNPSLQKEYVVLEVEFEIVIFFHISSRLSQMTE